MLKLIREWFKDKFTNKLRRLDPLWMGLSLFNECLMHYVLQAIAYHK